MTETVVRRRTPWLAATVHSVRSETAVARTIVLDVPGWPGHVAGQHADVKLTAPDGYSAQRSYSLAAPADGERIELTVQLVEDGEVSPYLVDELLPTDQLEVRGPIGGWFTWHATEPGPVLLVAGGSGIVPLMAMVRERARAGSTAPFALVYSTRGPADAFYADELAAADIATTMVYTRTATDTRPAGRITAADLPDAAGARVYVCGPTGFVETVSDLLLAHGHDAANIRTERFGPSGG
ncbi:ferredoxin reductase [Actinophytocola algeriensis]|uniref:Ferredoxin-NADP reductase n=1 Tax=Actinophytocola algeriensis TaxID=1768010 RepID=A0A7W7QC18_9PSEU|nr:ferredoxin reductase [Actinophytocola algeriensis]MBB4910504.1 ferredoxin-NADP reductase [Actinophytocola algeriensis]MBE1480507.1 ferredoxin-NADP reductase [Actinophytocola algeriensis]